MLERIGGTQLVFLILLIIPQNVDLGLNSESKAHLSSFFKLLNRKLKICDKQY